MAMAGDGEATARVNEMLMAGFAAKQRAVGTWMQEALSILNFRPSPTSVRGCCWDGDDEPTTESGDSCFEEEGWGRLGRDGVSCSGSHRGSLEAHSIEKRRRTSSQGMSLRGGRLRKVRSALLLLGHSEAVRRS